MKLKWLKHGVLNGLVMMNFAGNPFIQLKENQVKPKLKDHLVFISDTYFRTNAHDYVVLNINDLYRVTVLPDSILTVDGVRRPGEFFIRSIYLRRGQIHINSLEEKKVAQVTSSDSTEDDDFEAMKIQSDFFSFLTQKNQKISLFLDVNLKLPSLEVCNQSSEFKLELFNHEKVQNLKTNEGIKFIGVLDKNNHITFDLLLENRKIPKGQWQGKKACSADQSHAIEEEVVQFHMKSVQDAEKVRREKLAEKKRKDALYPCHEPYGKLDQCHFVLRDKKCLRERCNAEGRWSNQTEIGIVKNQCSAAGEVKACGY